MSWMDRIGDLLNQYSSTSGNPGTPAAAQPATDVSAHFDQIAQVAPAGAIGQALAQSFRSPQTPSFAESVSKLFTQSNGEQKAGLLNMLTGASSSAMLSQILSRVGLPTSATNQLTPDQAQQFSPSVVQQLAAHAEQNSPSIVESVSHFYAQHPTLVKFLGAVVLSKVLSTMAQQHRSF